MAEPRNTAAYHLISFLFILNLGVFASAHRHLMETVQDTVEAALPPAVSGGCAPEPSPSTETQASPGAPARTSCSGGSNGAPGVGLQTGWGGFGVPTYGGGGGIVPGFGFGWPGISIGIPAITIGGAPAGISIGGGFYGGNICFTPGLGYSYCFMPGGIGGAVSGGGGPLIYPPPTGAYGQTQPVSPGGRVYPPPTAGCGQAQPVNPGGQVHPPPPVCGQKQPASPGGKVYPPPPPAGDDRGEAQPVSPGGQMNSNAAAPEVFEDSEEDNQLN